MASTLFRMIFAAMPTYAFLDCNACFPIRCRFDGKLFNIRMLQAKSKVQTDVLDKPSMKTNWQRMLNQRQKFKGLWIACLKLYLTTSTKD